MADSNQQKARFRRGSLVCLRAVHVTVRDRKSAGLWSSADVMHASTNQLAQDYQALTSRGKCQPLSPNSRIPAWKGFVGRTRLGRLWGASTCTLSWGSVGMRDGLKAPT